MTPGGTADETEMEVLDSAIQQLFGLGLRLQACQQLAEAEHAARTEIIGSAITSLGDVIDRLRSRMESLDVGRRMSSGS